MTTSENGYNLIKEFEGWSSTPYICPAGKPTIGWGLTFYADGKSVTMKDPPLTRIQGDILLEKIFMQVFHRHIPTNVNQNQFDALSSLIWNIGVTNFNKSTLRMKVKNNPEDKSIRDEFMKWNKARKGTKLVVLDGLTRRRKKEADLYFS